MTRQEFYLQATIQIAASMNSALIQVNGGTTPEGRKRVAGCAVNGALDLLREVESQWEQEDTLFQP